MTKPRVLIFVIVLLVLGTAALYWRNRRPRFDVRNVVLISLDTCRADHLGCYGYDGKTTPHIDALAEQSVLLTNALAAAPMTLPSHSTMLTGTNPPYHGVHDNLNHRLPESNETLAEILRDHGFVTGGIISTFVLDSRFGLDQGFDTYHDEFEEEHNLGHYTERKADESTRLAVQWLEQHHEERFFLFLHYFDPHDPYKPPEPFATRFKDNLYDGEIAFTDHCVGKVLDKLKRLGVYDNTLIIVVGDHGEMLGEHGESRHMYFIYQSALHVPLIFKVPGQTRAIRIDEPVGVIDIMRTVCGMLGLDVGPQVRGEDLSVAFRGGKLPSAERYRYCESVTPTQYQANSLLGVVDGRWKLIQTTRPELYDLAADPIESNNLVETRPEEALRLQARLERILEHQLREDVESQTALDAESLRKLQSIGYVGGSGGRANRLDYYDQPADRDDAKDLIGFHRDYNKVLGLQTIDRPDKARRLLQQLVDRRPDFLSGHLKLATMAVEQKDADTAIVPLKRVLELNPDYSPAHFHLGRILLEKQQFEEAIASFERTVQLDPGKPGGYHLLGAALAATGRTDEAIEQYRLTLELDPEFAAAHVNLGVALAKQKKTDQAIEHYLRALESDPEYTEARYNLAQAYEAQGKTDEAIGQYQRTLELDGEHANAHMSLGALLGYRRQWDSCEHHFREALRIEPQWALAHYNLARMLHGQGRLDEAMPHYQTAVDLDPEDARAHYRFGQALVTQDRPEEALVQYQDASRLRPHWDVVLSEMAWCMSARPDWPVYAPEEGLLLAERALQLSSAPDARLLDYVAIAQAAAGQFDVAIATARKALSVEPAASNADFADEINTRIELYEQGKPYVKGSAVE